MNRAHYKKLGQYIQPINIRNRDLRVSTLLGINIDKFFMPSVANVVGTDLSKYKVVKKNQFACNRMHVGRDYRIPIALSKKNNPFIVSPAYTVFEIIDTSILLPDYLMMWFSRKEFDRNAWYHTDADVRGGLPWELFCDLELPIPTIEKQQEIVKEYNTVINRIKLNEQLNQKLEETAQALYKHWFVDFEFPNKEGKPYKSNGGEMVYNEALDGEIPEEWNSTFLSDFANFDSGFSYKGVELKNSKDALLTIKNFSKQGTFKVNGYKEIQSERIKESHLVKEGDVIVAHTDLTKGIIIAKSIIVLDDYGYDKVIASMDTVKVKSNNNCVSNSLINQIINSKDFNEFAKGYVNGSTVLHLSKKALPLYKLPFPEKTNILIGLSEGLEIITNYKKNILKTESKLISLKALLLSKMTKIEIEKEIV